MKKIKVAVIFGGTNTEHEISLVSARSIIQNLDPARYQVLPIMITKDNHWLAPQTLLTDHHQIKSLPQAVKKSIIQSPHLIASQHPIDVYFPVLHGPYGEDGTIQGMLEMMQVPYVGCGVLASAVCMDKDFQKRLCLQAGLPLTPYTSLTINQYQTPTSPSSIYQYIKLLKYPLFVKPANQGSSVGVIKVTHQQQLIPAIDQAFLLDTKIVIEQGIDNPREIECSILGTTENPQASVLGEIIPSNEFYDYNAKYIDGKSKEVIPANLSGKLSLAIQAAAKKAFSVTGCYGLARVDFLVEREGENQPKFYLSELNTLPGFTSISMYPKLWAASGVTYPQLLDKLISLALARHRQKQTLQTTFRPKTDWYE